MKILVAYFTQTGNTKVIAEAIHEEVLSRGNDASLVCVEKLAPGKLDDYDLVFLGSACHDTDLARPVKSLLSKMTPSPPFCLAGFVTHATYLPQGGERQRKLHEEWAGNCKKTFERTCQRKSIAWCGYFSCQGAPSAPIEDFIHRKIVMDTREWEEYLNEVRKHPDEADRGNARQFAREVLAQIK